MKFQPAIKWSGSKRSQEAEIVNMIPREIGTYYEPFCGGCSVLRRLLSSKEHRVNSFVCSDANSDLIDLWNSIRDSPEFIVQEYTQMWNELNKDNDLERKKFYINNSSNDGDLVLDPLIGTGSCGVACKETNRNFLGIELDQKFYDIAKERLE